MKWLKIVSEIQKIDFINFTLYKISKKFDFIDIMLFLNATLRAC